MATQIVTFKRASTFGASCTYTPETGGPADLTGVSIASDVRDANGKIYACAVTVIDPTFVLVNVYRRADNCQLFHFDTYRVESINEAEELDLDAMLSSGPLVIEWPERMLELLPGERLWIQLEYVDEDRREFTFLPVGLRYISLINEFLKSSFGTD